MNLPSPQELGLPSKYTAWWPNQDRAILDGVECACRFCVQVQRSGRGKTLTYMTQTILMAGKRVVILTANKGLTDQAVKEWSDYGLVEVRGKGTYKCDGIPGMFCDDGALSRCVYKSGSMCGHNNAVQIAKETRVLVTTYACWIAANRYAQGFGDFDVMICDEGHTVPAEVAKAMSTQIGSRELEAIGCDWPDGDRDDLKVWKQWAGAAFALADTKLEKLKSDLDRSREPDRGKIKSYKNLKNLSRKLADVATCRVAEWVVDTWHYGYQFDPVNPSEYSERVLWRKVPKILFTSGTVQHKTMSKAGIEEGDYEFFDYPSKIEPQRSPFMCIDTGVRISRNTPDWEIIKLINKYIDPIIEDRMDRKGIIHTANNHIRDLIMEHSAFGHNGTRLMLSNYKQKGDITSEVIADFKARAKAVLVSASVTTGYDFPFDYCRYQILVKAPWSNIGSKVERARIADDQEYAIHNVADAIAQCFSRGDRGEEDWQEFFSLDEGVRDLLWRHVHLFPAWMPPYVQYLPAVPPPMRMAA